LAPEIVCDTGSQSLREDSSKVVASVLQYLSALTTSARSET
jgi:hypothetical protein